MLIKLLIGSVFSFFISCILHYCSAKKVYIRNGIFEKNKRIFKNMQCVIFPLIIIFLVILIFILLAFTEIDFNLSSRFQTGAAVIFGILLLVSIFSFVGFIIQGVCLQKKIKYSSAGCVKEFVLTLLMFQFGMYEYFLSRYFKDTSGINESRKNDLNGNIRKELIQSFNLNNFIASIFLVGILFFALIDNELLNQLFNVSSRINMLGSYIISTLFIRALGRSLEIIYAFYNDAVRPGDKQSSLNNNDRIKLAIFSFFELLIIYTGIYSVVNNEPLLKFLFTDNGISDVCFTYKNIIVAMFDSFKTGTVVGADFSLTFDDIQSGGIDFWYKFTSTFFVSLQVLTNLVLTLFSLAKYSND